MLIDDPEHDSHNLVSVIPIWYGALYSGAPGSGTLSYHLWYEFRKPFTKSGARSLARARLSERESGTLQ